MLRCPVCRIARRTDVLTCLMSCLPYCWTAEHEFVDPHTPTVKHIAGQAAYQLAVLYGLIAYAPALLGIPGDCSPAQGWRDDEHARAS
jgi:hypothetical protein